MAVYTFNADGTTANRTTLTFAAPNQTVPTAGSAPNTGFSEFTWVNNSDSAITVEYTISDDAIVSHDWNNWRDDAAPNNDPYHRGGDDKASVRRYGPNAAPSDGRYVVTLPSRTGGVLRVDASVVAGGTATTGDGVVIAAVTDTVKPIEAKHRTVAAKGGRLIIESVVA